MTLTVAVGHAQALDGREAGMQAVNQALNRLGSASPTFGIVISSHSYQPREVSAGVTSLTADMPLIGFSTPAGLTHEGMHPHSVVVALLSGSLRAEVHWLPGYAQSGRETANRLAQLTSVDAARQSLLFFADGFNGGFDIVGVAFVARCGGKFQIALCQREISVYDRFAERIFYIF